MKSKLFWWENLISNVCSIASHQKVRKVRFFLTAAEVTARSLHCTGEVHSAPSEWVRSLRSASLRSCCLVTQHPFIQWFQHLLVSLAWISYSSGIFLKLWFFYFYDCLGIYYLVSLKESFLTFSLLPCSSLLLSVTIYSLFQGIIICSYHTSFF